MEVERPPSSPGTLKRNFEATGFNNVAEVERSNIKNLCSEQQVRFLPSTQDAKIDVQSQEPVHNGCTNGLVNKVVAHRDTKITAMANDGRLSMTTMQATQAPTHSTGGNARLADSVSTTSLTPGQSTAQVSISKAEIKARKEAEKQQRQQDKERRDQERARRREEKQLKEAEADSKREEKRRAREEKENQKAEELAKKAEEKRLKEDELNKKAKSQLRLNAFFGQPSVQSRKRSCSSELSRENSTHGASNDKVDRLRDPSESSPERSSRAKTTVEISAYEKFFPPFFLQTYTRVAPQSAFSRDTANLAYACRQIDNQVLSTDSEIEIPRVVSISDSLSQAPLRARRRYQPPPAVKGLVAQVTSMNECKVVSSAATTTAPSRSPRDILRSVPIKSIKFSRDVRPPYLGTCTNIHDVARTRKIARRPFSRFLTTTNYDYDSEAEWEEPEEGEDLLSEGDEEDEEEEEGEMDGFLDDQDIAETKSLRRRPILGNLEPVCSGICWQNLQPNDSSLNDYAIEILTESPIHSIDPYSNAYWNPPNLNSIASSAKDPQKTLPGSNRLPLHSTSANPSCSNHSLLLSSTKSPHPHASPVLTPQHFTSSSQTPPAGPNMAPSSFSSGKNKPVKRLLPNDILDDFKRAVHGSDLTKLGLIEILKKQFPKQSKDAIKDTLDLVAERVGEKMSEKRWSLRAAV